MVKRYAIKAGKIYTDEILHSFQAKVAFATADEESSKCLIGILDASKLQGRGDTLFLLPGDVKSLHLQGVNVSDATIQAVIERCSK